MDGVTMTAQELYAEIQDLPQQSLIDLAAFVEFLRFKANIDTEAKPSKKTATPPAPAEFLQAVAAFERLKPELLNQYSGRVVAIYQEQVVAVGDDRLSVFSEVVSKFGYVPVYIEWVEPETPRRVRMPSTWVAR